MSYDKRERHIARLKLADYLGAVVDELDKTSARCRLFLNPVEISQLNYILNEVNSFRNLMKGRLPFHSLGDQKEDRQ